MRYLRRERDDTNPDLARRLRIALFLALLAVLVLATIAAAVTAYLESSDIQDETLLSVARLVKSNRIDVHNEKATYRPHELDDGVQVWRIDSERHGRFRIKSSVSDGYHTIGAKGQLWRVYITRNTLNQQRYAIVQNLSVKTELAKNSALNTALPLLGLFLLVPLLVTVIVRHSFKPLNRLSSRIASSDSLEIDLNDRAEIPLEVLPFVSSIDSLLQKNAAYNRRQQRFIADAAHELRTPITALALEIDNLQKAGNSSARDKREHALKSSASRLQRLVNQLLDLARAQAVGSGKTETVSVNDLLRHQIADLYPLVEQKNLRVMVEPNDALSVEDSQNQLQHLIRNALSNAIKYSPIDGEMLIELYERDGKAVFCVNDEGPGVGQSHLAKLHEPFYRPIEQSTKSGAGLGLAICHGVAQRLGGALTLQNRVSGGFRFCYTQELSTAASNHSNHLQIRRTFSRRPS